MPTFSIQSIRDLLDRNNSPSFITEEGDLVTTFSPDDDFPYDVNILITVSNEGNRLFFAAMAPEFKPDCDLLALANRHNYNEYFPTAVVRNGGFKLEQSFYITEEVSQEYIDQTCIKSSLSAIWQAFVKVYRICATDM